jgi:hypothetical protein
MKKDIFSVDFWEFDLPDHPKIQKHLLDYIVSDEGTRQKLEESTQTNISQETYGGQEYLIGDFFRKNFKSFKKCRKRTRLVRRTLGRFAILVEYK